LPAWSAPKQIFSSEAFRLILGEMRLAANRLASKVQMVNNDRTSLADRQVKFTEWKLDNQLRQPVFLGLRTDKEAKDVVRE
jgi:hypothetical protein